MSGLQNILGEGGHRLTILSVLSSDPGAVALQAQGRMTLRQALDELSRIGGSDGKARVVLNVVLEGRTEPEFTTEENVAITDVVESLYRRFGEDGEMLTVLSVLGPQDDPLGPDDPTGSGESGDSGGDDVDAADGDSGGRHPIEALRRLRDSVHQLFGGSVEDGFPPTVLSLLVGPHEDDTDPGADPGGADRPTG